MADLYCAIHRESLAAYQDWEDVRAQPAAPAATNNLEIWKED